MKRKIIICDLCGKDITHEDERYRFKKYEYTYMNMETLDFLKWERLDMCEHCYSSLLRYIAENKRRTDNG